VRCGDKTFVLLKMPQLSPHNIQEEQNIFFVYDKSELRNNESNPEDGLLFFFPSTRATQEQFSLVGQLVGIFLLQEQLAYR